MKKAIFLLVALLVVVSAMPVAAGNGAPNGPHYNLNIIGVPKSKSADMNNANGHVIFVPLGKDGEVASAKISLLEGPSEIFDFHVIDANGTDADGASFQLPNPDPDGDGTTWYSVYARALGQPGGKARMQTCYTDDTGTWCAVDFVGGVAQIELNRTNGPQKFVNYSKDLLYIDYCTAWDLTDPLNPVCTNVVQVPLFSQDLQEYFWNYDNQGLKLAQLRFYEVPTQTGW